jgi:hypothetical protein
MSKGAILREKLLILNSIIQKGNLGIWAVHSDEFEKSPNCLIGLKVAIDP